MTTRISYADAAAGGSGVDLITPYNKLVDLVPTGIQVLISVVGVACIFYAVVKFLWQKSRQGGGGGGGRGSQVFWAMVIGVLFAAPVVIGPVFLWIVGVGLDVVFKLKDLANSG